MCLIQTFNMAQCTKDEASCALDCLKGVTFVAKYDKPVVTEIENFGSERSQCEKNCALDYGICLATTFSFVQCSKAEVACGLTCLKKDKVEGLNTVQASAMEVC